MKLNTMLTKNQIICSGTMKISSLKFQLLTVAGVAELGFVAPWSLRRGVLCNNVLTLPGNGVGRELRLRWKRTAELAVVPVQIEARAERGDHELRELAKPVSEAPPVTGLRRIATSDRL